MSGVHQGGLDRYAAVESEEEDGRRCEERAGSVAESGVLLAVGGVASSLSCRLRGGKVLVSSRTNGDIWIARSERRPKARLRLFCFPYAGGGSAIFRQWPAQLSRDIDPVLVELPGR
ncbi:MAG: hypothetical protein KAJ12_11495, partial [Bacteroidetes bacterium]|nr:hypothetical protein [Bacteroidota bacterium]